MEWTSLNDLREMFFKFFQSKNHLKLSSFSLVPRKQETSLLLINSGMAPMKDWFLGYSQPPSKRVVTCQKCVRTVDLQNVGKTDRHGTFFEMLGNFSFGDYFKKEAIGFAWEFVTRILNMPISRLYVTVFEDDDEARLIWEKEQGVEPSHIFKLGKDDNFWEIGKGPCGPCSELYFDRGEQFGCGKRTCGPGCDCDRFIEFWNLVFSQYSSDGDGHYESLVQKNIDTGMGLERLACIVQGVDCLFEVDSVKKILLEVSKLAQVVYGEDKKKDVLIRIIVDHVRSSVFLISDGVLPSNEGRGYVLRRLIRRMLTSAQVLKIGSSFLDQLAKVVIGENFLVYPELERMLDQILQILQFEEQSFNKILVNGHKLFNDLTLNLKSKNETRIDAHSAFKLCDTFGMPFDLLSDLADQNGFVVDESGFLDLMNKQKQRAKLDAASKAKGWQEDLSLLSDEKATSFVGYETLQSEGCLKAVFVEGHREEVAMQTKAKQLVSLIFDKTPFYAQGGGQVGDWGFIENADGFMFAEVVDCKKLKGGYICHEAHVFDVPLKVGETFILKVQSNYRESVARNHTAVHILHQVLVNVLGKHVHQAGQLVSDKKLRFDFSHFNALSEVELLKIEHEVNRIVLSCLDVKIVTMGLAEAKRLGAKALFDEKYGETVRVVEVGNFSKELCGGTHVKNSGEIGLFKIVSEVSVGSGIRRIEAVTGFETIMYFNKLCRGCRSIFSNLKVDNLQLACEKIDEIKVKLKESEAEVERLKLKISRSLFFKSLKRNYFEKSGLDLAILDSDMLCGRELKNFGEDLIRNYEKLVLLICSQVEEKRVFLVGCAKSAVHVGLDAGKIVKVLADMIKGKGGGKPSIAMSGAKSSADLEVIRLNFEKVINQQFI